MDKKLQTALQTTVSDYYNAREEFSASHNAPHVKQQHRMAMDYLDQVLQHFMNAGYLEYQNGKWQLCDK